MPNSPICLDASFVVRFLVSEETAAITDALWVEWHHAGRRLVAPTLLYYEVSNALHRYERAGILSPEEVIDLLDIALSLDITLYGDADLHRQALILAEGLGLPAAYDAHYLALAERLNADFWTADRRLASATAHMPWVRVLGESAGGGTQ